MNIYKNDDFLGLFDSQRNFEIYFVIPNMSIIPLFFGYFLDYTNFRYTLNMS
jgi:hypothetical protein